MRFRISHLIWLITIAAILSLGVSQTLKTRRQALLELIAREEQKSESIQKQFEKLKADSRVKVVEVDMRGGLVPQATTGQTSGEPSPHFTDYANFDFDFLSVLARRLNRRSLPNAFGL